MIWGRRPLVCVAAVMVACWGACAGTQRCRADENGPHALQGYGRVSLDVPDTGERLAVFQCDDNTAADRLLSKLLADFSWDRLTGPQPQMLTDGVSALKVEPHGFLLFAGQGAKVYALSGESPKDLDRQRTRDDSHRGTR